MKLRQLYSQETNVRFISKINSTVANIGARVPGFGLRRLPVGILTVFWLSVWVGIIGVGTYVTATLLNIPLTSISEPWLGLTNDIYTLVTTPVGIPTTLATVYGLSMYIKSVYGGGTRQKYSNRSLNTQPLLLSLVITGIGIYIFFIEHLMTGFAVTAFGTIVATHYTKVITLHDRHSEYNHYDLHKINAVVRSLTLWSIVYAFTVGVSTITLAPLVINAVYMSGFILLRNYTNRLVKVYDDTRKGFIQKLKDAPYYYKEQLNVLQSNDISTKESDYDTDPHQEERNQNMNLYSTMRGSQNVRRSSPSETSSAETTEMDIDRASVKDQLEPAIDVEPSLVNDFEQKMREFLEIVETYSSADIEESTDKIKPEQFYTEDEQYFKLIHMMLLNVEENVEPHTHLSTITEESLQYSSLILEELGISRTSLEDYSKS